MCAIAAERGRGLEVGVGRAVRVPALDVDGCDHGDRVGFVCGVAEDGRAAVLELVLVRSLPGLEEAGIPERGITAEAGEDDPAGFAADVLEADIGAVHAADGRVEAGGADFDGLDFVGVACWAREGGPGERHEGEEDSGSEGPGHGDSLAGDGVCRTPETQTGPGFGRGLCLHYSSSDHGIVHRGRVAAIGLWDSFVSACRSVKERSNRARFMRGLLRPGFIEDDGGETCPWRPLCLACLMQAGTLHNEDSVDGVQLASHVRTSVRTVIPVPHHLFDDGW